MTPEQARDELARALGPADPDEAAVQVAYFLDNHRDALIVALGGTRQFIDLGTVPVWVIPE